MTLIDLLDEMCYGDSWRNPKCAGEPLTPYEVFWQILNYDEREKIRDLGLEPKACEL